MDFVIVVFILIFFLAMKPSNLSWDLSKDKMLPIRGFCALCVIFGHLVKIMPGGVISNTYSAIQLLGLPVPIFFFCQDME